MFTAITRFPNMRVGGTCNNQIIDDYYESNDTHTSDEAWWKDQGIELAAGIGYTIIQ